MAVERVGMAIAIWVVCAVLLVVVIILAIYLFCCLRHRRRHACDIDEEEEVYSSRHEAYLENNNHSGTVELRVRDQDDDAQHRVYGDYRRAGAQDLLCDPVPGAYPTEALLVRLSSYQTSGTRGRVDILVNVLRQDVNVPDPRYTQNYFAILGNLYDQPGFFDDDFLLYTAPLYFSLPGRYVVQAYTVNTSTKVVGAVHQFIYVLSANGTGQIMSNNSTPAQAGASALASRNIDVTVDQQTSSLVPYGSAAAQAGAGASFYPPQPAYSTAANAAVVPASAGSRVSGDAYNGSPLPPRIEPSQGTVTTTTRIVLSPHPHSPGGDHIRYSVDGSYPSLTYTGPFTLSLPPASVLPERRLEVRVQAISLSSSSSALALPATVTAAGTVGDSVFSRYTTNSALVAGPSAIASTVTEATLTVRPAGYSYYDPALPAPSMRVRAQGAKLYFDETNNPMRTCTCYQIVYLDDARHHTVRFSKRRSELYRGQPIPLLDTIAMVYAWTVDEAALVASDDDEEADQATKGRPEEAEPFAAFSPTAPSAGRAGRSAPRIRSVATIYNCSRASTEHGQPSRKRVPAGASLLPPPVLCISCDEVEVVFDEPPAHSLIAYTLNNKEPALLDVSPPACAVPIQPASSAPAAARSRSKPAATPRRSDKAAMDVVEGDADGHSTFIYETGKPIHVTQLESDGVYITARLFAPVYEAAGGDVVGDFGAQGGTASAGGAHLGYRYGDAFHRGFFFNMNK